MKPTLLILAAGMGSRYGSLKQIDPVGPSGEAIIDYSVYDAKKAGFGKIVFVIRKNIEEDFKSSLLKRFEKQVEVDYVFQELDMLPDGFVCPAEREKPWGTAHAILMAQDAIHTPFAAINADDFYGFDAFSKMAGFLTNEASGTRYSMAGYYLADTLSPHGTVSRGVCRTQNGQLVSIDEHVKIARENGDIISFFPDENRVMPEDSVVSMNYWGFTTTIFDQINAYFSDFLRHNMHDLKSEFYIPKLVDVLIRENKCTVDVLPTSARWFGVTYREDKPTAQATIRELIDEGAYPERLWS